MGDFVDASSLVSEYLEERIQQKGFPLLVTILVSDYVGVLLVKLQVGFHFSKNRTKIVEEDVHFFKVSLKLLYLDQVEVYPLKVFFLILHFCGNDLVDVFRLDGLLDLGRSDILLIGIPFLTEGFPDNFETLFKCDSVGIEECIASRV
jgi:membrane-bound acyltransferase YfiQ involved in biofilm formation